MIVLKFGGGLLDGATGLLRCAEEVRRRLSEEPIVVVSALRGVTDAIAEQAREAMNGRLETVPLRRRHLETARALGLDEALLERPLFEMEVLLRGVTQVRELSARVFDRLLSFGEWLSALLFAGALRNMGLAATPLFAADIGLLTDSRHTRAAPLDDIDEQLKANVTAAVGLPVVTGFVGRSRDGHVTTLGRNGSDYTASILAAALGAETAVVYTLTDGLTSADPAMVPGARPVEQLTWSQAAELAHFGATVLHPRTLLPLIRRNVPLEVRHLGPRGESTTRVTGSAATRVTVVAARRGLTLLHLRRTLLEPVAERMRHFLAALNRCGLSPLTMRNTLSQTDVVIEHGPPAKRVAYRLRGDWIEFPEDSPEVGGVAALAKRLGGEFEVKVGGSVTLVCVVSEEPCTASGLAALRAAGVETLLTSAGAAGEGTLFVVADPDAEQAVRALHAALCE